MATLSYSYRVRVAGYEWTGTVGDAAAYGPVDGLQISRKLSDDNQLWPSRIDPAECRFQLIVASMADVDAIDVGSVVLVEVSRPAGGAVTESFTGRVAELTAQPHAPLGMLLTLSCLDYKADLRELIVGDSPWPSESIRARIARVMSLAGYPSVPFDDYAGHPLNTSLVVTVTDRDIDAKPVLDLVENYLDQYAMDYGLASTDLDYRGYARGQLEATTDPVTGELTGWHIAPMFQRPAYTGPLRLTWDTGVPELWYAAPIPYGPSQLNMTMADSVDIASTYAITKDDVVTRVTVAGGDPAGLGAYVVTVDTGRTPVVTAKLEDSELAASSDAIRAAQLYLPGEQVLTRWVADSFVWHLELSAEGAKLPELGELMTVGGIPTDQNPNSREWYSGQVASYTFDLADKTATYTFTLRRPDFDAPNQGVMKWDSSELVGKEWNTLSDRDTWDDYRLIRGSL